MTYCFKDIRQCVGKMCWLYDVPGTPLENYPKGILKGDDAAHAANVFQSDFGV